MFDRIFAHPAKLIWFFVFCIVVWPIVSIVLVVNVVKLEGRTGLAILLFLVGLPFLALAINTVVLSSRALRELPKNDTQPRE